MGMKNQEEVEEEDPVNLECQAKDTGLMSAAREQQGRLWDRE